MIKITTIFGEDAVREYEENNELPSEEWLADNGGVVDEKEFETEAEYNAYIAGGNDATDGVIIISYATGRKRRTPRERKISGYVSELASGAAGRTSKGF